MKTFRYILAFILASICGYSQTAKTKSALYTEVDTTLASGQQITATQLRGVFKNTIASSMVPLTDGTALLTTAIGTTVQAYDADLTTWAGITPGTGVGTALAATPNATGGIVTFGGNIGAATGVSLTSASSLTLASAAGSNINLNVGTAASDKVVFNGTLDASSSTAAAVEIPGGLAVAKKAYFGTSVNVPWAGGIVMAGTVVARGNGSFNFFAGGAGNDSIASAYSNSGLGYDSLHALTSGDDNDGSGSESLYSLQSGNSNTGHGKWALRSNVSGSTNTAIGASAGYAATGSGGVYIGNSAGKYETGSDAFYVDNQSRTNTAGDKAGALLYGTFNATPASQTLRINAAVTTLGAIVSESTVGGSNLSGTNTGDTNNFGSIAVSGQTTVTANANPTALTYVAGTGMAITTNNTTKTVTFNSTAGGTGNVTVSGTPTSGQIAEWTTATNVQGLAVTGTGNVVRDTSPTLITPNIGAATGTSLTGATTLTLGSAAGSNIVLSVGTAATDKVTANAALDASNSTTAGVQLAGGLAVAKKIYGGDLISATGNVSGGNLTTGGLVSATGNVSGGNVTTTGLMSAGTTITATGNVAGGNLTTGGLVSATGNVTGGNLTTGGLISATGNITGGNLTITNNIVLSENSSVMLDPAGSADEKYSGITVSGTSNATIAYGQAVILDSGGKWALGNASNVTISGPVAIGLCTANTTQNNPITVLVYGTMRSVSFPASLTVGAQLYLSNVTAGNITTTRPAATDHVIRVLGWPLDAEPNTILFQPSADFIQWK